MKRILFYDRIPLLKEVKPHKNGKSNDGDSKRYLLENGVGSIILLKLQCISSTYDRGKTKYNPSS